ncbi:MAG: helix-turn-helix domain-containing protein [Vallitalea sp.]|nr:helix-turn-helix domain-containing protein [Vallitalea sp.]
MQLLIFDNIERYGDNMSVTPAPALEKGLKLLEIIAKQEQVSFNKLQEMTGFNVSSLNRYLHTLRYCDYIQKNSDNKYIIGLKFFTLAEKNNRWTYLKQVAKKYLVELSERFGISLILLGYSNDQFTVLTKQAHKDNITMMSIGTCHYYEQALTWALPYVVHLDEVEQKRIEECYMSHSCIEHFEEFKLHFKENGYVLDNGFINKNILRIGIPLYAGESKPIGIIGAGTFKQHLNDNVEDVILAMKEVSINISKMVF